MTPNVNVIELRQSGANTYLLWAVEGILQSAPQIKGPWTNVSGATSPYPMIIGSQPEQYFRVEETSGP